MASLEMRDQLAAYRAKKAQDRQDVVKNSSRTTFSYLMRSQKFQAKNSDGPTYQGGSGFVDPTSSSLSIWDRLAYSLECHPVTRPLVRHSWITQGVIWLLFWGLSIHAGFGAVFFVISGLVLVYFNTRTRARGEGEVSAYSVFNKDFERIDGTLTAEQFEKEIRHGLGST